MSVLIRLTAAILVVAGGPAFMLAQEDVARHPFLENDFIASAGVYVFDRDVKLGVDGTLSARRDFDIAKTQQSTECEQAVLRQPGLKIR